MPRRSVKFEAKATITHLVVGGFKSIRDRTEIALRPLTLLCGRNSSGKSSFMQPFLLMKQTLEAPVDPGPLLLHGPNVKFTQMDEIFWKGEASRKSGKEFAVGFRGIAPLSEKRHFEQSVVVFFREDKKTKGATIDRVDMVDDGRRRTVREGAAPTDEPWAFGVSIGSGVSARFVLARCFLRLQVESDKQPTFNWILPPPLGRDALQAMTELIHLPGIRGMPERAYPSVPVGHRFDGPFPPYTASIIADWQDRKDIRLRRLGDWLAKLELSHRAEARRLDATRVELRVGRLPHAKARGAKDLVNIADVGVGVSQVLPLLVALLAAEPGQILYVEQPEIHLHPSAEVALADVLLEAARRGVVIIAETHSLRLIKSVQTAVATDPALAPLVGLHWFSRGKDGATRVDSADLDEHGAFGAWPEDLADVELDIEERFLRAAMAKGAE